MRGRLGKANSREGFVCADREGGDKDKLKATSKSGKHFEKWA